MDSHNLKFPVPMVLLAFSAAELASMLGRFAGPAAVLSCDALVLGLLAWLVARAVRHRACARACVDEAEGAAMLSTVFFTFVVLAGHASTFSPGLGLQAWAVSAIVSALYLVWFTFRFAISMEIADVGPTVFIPYSACAVIATEAPAEAPEWLRSFMFLFVLVGFVVIASAFTLRLRINPLPWGAVPMRALTASPVALATGVYASLEEPDPVLLSVLAALSQLMFVALLAKVPLLVAGGFRYSMVAFSYACVAASAAAVAGLAAAAPVGLAFHIVSMFFAYLEVVLALVVTLGLLGYGILVALDAGRAVASDSEADSRGSGAGRRHRASLSIPAPCIVEA